MNTEFLSLIETLQKSENKFLKNSLMEFIPKFYVDLKNAIAESNKKKSILATIVWFYKIDQTKNVWVIQNMETNICAEQISAPSILYDMIKEDMEKKKIHSALLFDNHSISCTLDIEDLVSENITL
jgi:hypothetical protein